VLEVCRARAANKYMLMNILMNIPMHTFPHILTHTYYIHICEYTHVFVHGCIYECINIQTRRFAELERQVADKRAMNIQIREDSRAQELNARRERERRIMQEAQAIRQQVSFGVKIGLISCRNTSVLTHYGGVPGDLAAGLFSCRNWSLFM